MSADIFQYLRTVASEIGKANARMAAMSAEPHQQREADDCDQQRRQDRHQQNHLSSSSVTGA